VKKVIFTGIIHIIVQEAKGESIGMTFPLHPAENPVYERAKFSKNVTNDLFFFVSHKKDVSLYDV
jgi:hypothetical protein